MESEILVESFVYQEGTFYILLVPSIQKEPIAKAKTQLEVMRKAINLLRKNHKDKIIELSNMKINTIVKYEIPKNSTLFPLPIKVGQRVKNFKRFTSSMVSRGQVNVITKSSIPLNNPTNRRLCHL